MLAWCLGDVRSNRRFLGENGSHGSGALSIFRLHRHWQERKMLKAAPVCSEVTSSIHFIALIPLNLQRSQGNAPVTDK